MVIAVVLLILTGITIYLFRTAPEGHEDNDGFHRDE